MMMRRFVLGSVMLVPVGFVPAAAGGQAPPPPTTESVTAPVPDHVDIRFAYGSAEIGPNEQATLDRVAALYRKARPRVMIVAGSTDPTGDSAANLGLSLRRAQSVMRALVDRGLPAGSFEVDAKGQNDPPVPASGDQPRDRVTVITWKLAATG
jgi:OOP family OmpA-OmpF porin